MTVASVSQYSVAVPAVVLLALLLAMAEASPAVEPAAAEVSEAAPTTPPTRSACAAALEPPKIKGKRQRMPKIDIDAAIEKHMNEIKEATKLVMAAKKCAKNEKRRKKRLWTKVGGLSIDDLDRALVMKRCGIRIPEQMSPEASLAVMADFYQAENRLSHMKIAEIVADRSGNTPGASSSEPAPSAPTTPEA